MLLPLETALLAAVLLIVVPAAVALITGPGEAFVTLGRAATSVFTLADVLLAARRGPRRAARRAGERRRRRDAQMAVGG